MRKQVELLEHHADFAAHLVDLLEVLGQFHAVDDDAAALPVLEPVDAAQQRRLAAARRAADHDALAAHDLQVDVAQHVKAAEPLVQADDLDRDLVLRRAHVERECRPIRPRSCSRLGRAKLSILSQRGRAVFSRRSMDSA